MSPTLHEIDRCPALAGALRCELAADHAGKHTVAGASWADRYVTRSRRAPAPRPAPATTLRPWPRCSCGGPAAPVGAPALSLSLDVETRSETNARDKWARIHRVEKQRKDVEEAFTLPAGSIPERGPWCVRPTRLSSSELDDDNLSASMKAIRDSVAAAIGVDDGSPSIAWLYAQAKGRGVRVDVWSCAEVGHVA